MRYRLSLSIAALLLPAAAFAQNATATAPAPATTPALGGPAIPGVCLIAQNAVIENSAVGKAATARLQQLVADARTEIANDRKPVDADIQAYQAEAAKLTPEQRQTREQALQARLAPIEAKDQQRSREIQATQQKALQRIVTEAQPVIAQVYSQRNCGLLIERNVVVGGNMANDLTDAVIRGLDAKISTITFNRETLPQQ